VLAKAESQTASGPRRTAKHPREGDAAIVRRILHHYASRATFKSFSESPARRGATVFRFHWYRDLAVHATFDPATRTLTFRDLLPAVPARSAMDRELRMFVAGRSAHSVVEHRRVDLRKVAVACVNQRGAISLRFTLRPAAVEYGVRKAVHLVHDVLVEFLSDGRYMGYLVEQMRVNPESM
jgi:hypothetical protein